MDRSRPARLTALAVALLVLATACGSDDEPSATSQSEAPESSAAEGEPVTGGDLTIAREVDVKQLDPVAAVETATIHSLLMMMETLLVSNDEGGTDPLLAESVEPGADDLTWTVALRDGVTFSDGSPMTSEDVKFSLDRARTSEDGFAYLLAPIAEVSIVDELNLTLVTSAPVAYLPALLALWTGAIIPADFAGQSEEAFFEAPVGTGPFAFSSWEPGGDMELVRNDSYWEEGKPYLDSVTWTLVSDADARLTQLQGGQAQVVTAPFSAIDQLEGVEGVEVREFPSLLNQFLMFNLSKEPFDDVNVRTAIAHALDKESMQDAALFGRGEVACSILPPSIAFYSPDVDCLPFDLAAAEAAMAESSVPDGFSTTLLIAAESEASTIAQIVVENLRPLGIEVEITQVDPSQLYETQSEGDYDMIYQGWGSDIPDPDEQLTFMLDPEAGGVESYWTFYDSSEVVEKVTAARQEFDEDARSELYAEIQDIQAVDLPHVPLVFQPFLWAEADEVQDFEVLPTGNYRLQDVWLDS